MNLTKERTPHTYERVSDVPKTSGFSAHVVLWLFLSALSIRIVWALLAPQIDPFLQLNPLHGDAASYDRIAQNLVNGFGFSEYAPRRTSFWPPLYPYFLSLIYSTAGYHLTVSRLVQALLSSMVPVCLYLVGKKLYGERVALLTGIGLTLYPYLIYFAAWLIAESFFMTLFASALWVSSCLINSRVPTSTIIWRRIILLGLLLGLSILAKPTTLFFAPFWALWLFAAPQNTNLWQRVGSVILLTACTLLVVLPWSLRNYQVHHHFVLLSTNGGYTFLGANNPNAWGGHDEHYPIRNFRLNEAEMEERYYAEALAWIGSNPTDFIRLLVPKYQRLFSPLSVASFKEDYKIPGAPLVYLLYYTYLLLALAGFVISLKRWREIGFLYAPIIGVFVSTGLFYGDTRYTIPMVPSLVFFTALALDRCWLRIRAKTSRMEFAQQRS